MSDFSNRLSPAQAEVLALLAEECGETVQAIGKCLRHGLSSVNPLDMEGPNNAERLEKEVGDILATIDVAIANGVLSPASISDYAAMKLGAVSMYLHHAVVPKVPR